MESKPESEVNIADNIFDNDKELTPISHKDFNEFIKRRGL